MMKPILVVIVVTLCVALVAGGSDGRRDGEQGNNNRYIRLRRKEAISKTTTEDNDIHRHHQVVPSTNNITSSHRHLLPTWVGNGDNANNKEKAKEDGRTGTTSRTTTSCPKQSNPVCVHGDDDHDSDGITYQNACIALAQGETRYTNGPCTTTAAVGGPRFVSTSTVDFTMDQIKKYQDENFKLVGQMENLVTPPSSSVGDDSEWINDLDDFFEVENQDGDDIGESSNTDIPISVTPPGFEKCLHRVTKEGHVYVTKDHKPKPLSSGSNANGGPTFHNSPPPPPPPFVDGFVPPTNAGDGNGATWTEHHHHGGNNRDLAIIGTDTRHKVSSVFTWPYYRFGELDWESRNKEGGCSATIVGRNQVLTAAHCVFSIHTGQWRVPSQFSPGRYRWEYNYENTNLTLEPWGSWPVEYATIMTAWMSVKRYTYSVVKYDVAVLTLVSLIIIRVVDDYVKSEMID